jgi:hypothetical protein
MEKKIAHYFESYKDSNECFSTSDGYLFHKKTDAVAYAATLTDKAVGEHKRGEVKLKAEKAEKVEKPEGKPAKEDKK